MTGFCIHFCIQFTEEDFQLRNLSITLIMQCEALEGAEATRKSVEFGINCKSILTTLHYFDICSGVLVPDVMHDVLEGVLQYETKLLLNHCIFEEEYFTAETLEQLIASYELGFMETANRPTPINSKTLHQKDNSLKQNGKIFEQCCTFVLHVFSLFLGGGGGGGSGMDKKGILLE